MSLHRWRLTVESDDFPTMDALATLVNVLPRVQWKWLVLATDTAAPPPPGPAPAGLGVPEKRPKK